MVSLWDMLSLLSVGTTLGGAVAAAQFARGDSARYTLGIFLGLVLGLLSMAAIRKAGELVFRTLPPDGTSTKPPARLTFIYVAAAVWLMVPSPMLGLWVTGSIIRAVLP
ncbi:hypothetical protein [Myxococcus sp. Y35]|uniref:hypothetical protein n=1 Tax=Pseudomyxococcus flavus TaxID=3115648 RepID=UPI003CF849A1